MTPEICGQVSPMIVYAQNYPQLMNQARTAGFAKQDLLDLRAAFALAQRMSKNLYRAEGCPLLNHLVRTASIALAHTRDIQLVIAGLLHAVYVLQDFDHSTSSANLQRRRQEMKRLFGEITEQLLWDYEALPWHQQKHIEMHIHTVAQKSIDEKKILHLRLINELEDHMDHAMEYTGQSRRMRRNDEYFRSCQQLARSLRHNQLVDEMQTILDNPLCVEDYLCWDIPQGYELRESPWRRSWLESGIAQARRLKHKLASIIR
jgi:(p)ppGpp synthase/HD superfamily hydrolase